jgi:3-deoxy-D-manno-octulosonic-acid transferase
LVAGSTHDGEEVILADMAQRLRAKFPKLFLILVPRHFERCRDVGQKLARERNVKFVLSQRDHPPRSFARARWNACWSTRRASCVFFTSRRRVVFVGKSLTAMGGQNPIEPGALGKAMVFGPNMQNFSDITRGFLAQTPPSR